MSQEEWTKLRDSVPCVELYRYNPRHLYPKLNGYGDNGQRSLKLWQLLLTYWLPNWTTKTLALLSYLSLGLQVIYAGRSWSVISTRSLHYDVSWWCLVAGHAHWASMASRTAYSTWTPQKPTLFDDHYLRNRSTLDIGVLGYIGIVQHKELSPEVLSIPPGTPCILFSSVLFPMSRNFF